MATLAWFILIWRTEGNPDSKMVEGPLSANPQVYMFKDFFT